MRGWVASGHEAVTEAACGVLRGGGNAFDAAVAAGFASAVCEPALTSLGGGGFLLARTAGGRATLFDFFVDTPGRGRSTAELDPHFVPVNVRFPGADQVFNVGLGSAAVPGTLRGYLHVQRALGRLPLAEVVAPAVALARGGVIVNEAQGYFLELLRPIMTLTDASRALFEPGGRTLVAGDRFTNPDLAAFLEELARGGDRGLLDAAARRVENDMRAGGGLLTAADWSAYRVVEREPLRACFRDRELLANPPPSLGGSLVVLALRLLDAGDGVGSGFGSEAHLGTLIAVMREVEALREQLGEDAATLDLAASTARVFSRGTTHTSVVDAWGNAASMSTSNGEGSGYVIPDTGIVLNNMMGEDDLHPEGFHASPPGQRVASMMSPSIVSRAGEVELVAGSGGSKRIRSALVQVIANVLDFGMDVRGAVEAPRVHWDGARVQAEPGFDPDVLDRIARRWEVHPWSVRDVYFGGVHAVSAVGAGDGAGDPRRGGHAACA